MSTIAVFAVLAGGGAYAASKIGSSDIKKNAVESKHISKNAVRAKHIKKNQVKAAEIAQGAVGAGEHGTVPAARVYRTTNQSTDAPGNVTVSFDGESFDTAGMHSDTNPARLTAPIAGTYLLTGNARWEDDNDGTRLLFIALNGNSNAILAEVETGSAAGRQNTVGTARLAAGDYVELRGFEDSANGPLQILGGATSGATPALSMIWLAP